MDIYTLLFLIIAVFLIFRLRSVFGRRTGHERPPAEKRPRPDMTSPTVGNKVVPLPTRLQTRPPETELPNEPVLADEQPVPNTGNRALDQALTQLMRADRDFSQDHFLGGARAAYEMIVGAFANGDRKTLKPLLSKDVYDGFDHAIADREKLGHVVESSFIGLDSAEIIEAGLRGSMAQISVRFIAKMTQATRDRGGAVVSGDPTKVAEITDVWTFARDTTTRDPNWRLIATGPA